MIQAVAQMILLSTSNLASIQIAIKNNTQEKFMNIADSFLPDRQLCIHFSIVQNSRWINPNQKANHITISIHFVILNFCNSMIDAGINQYSCNPAYHQNSTHMITVDTPTNNQSWRSGLLSFGTIISFKAKKDAMKISNQYTASVKQKAKNIKKKGAK